MSGVTRRHPGQPRQPCSRAALIILSSVLFSGGLRGQTGTVEAISPDPPAQKDLTDLSIEQLMDTIEQDGINFRLKLTHRFYPMCGWTGRQEGGRSWALPQRANALRKRTGIAIRFLCISLGFMAKADATEDYASLEYKVKAAYLFHFAKFVEWPPNAFAGAKGPIVFGVVGKDPFGEILDETLKGKTAAEHPILIKRYKGAEDLEPCHILFVSASLDQDLKKVFEKLKDFPALTVGESENFAAKGGIIGFVLKEKKVRFEINVDGAKRSGLKVSSKLLQVGTVVKEGGGK